ncbi:hypothetical protein [Streptomyces sp. LMG1-1-1.1]|uniref:hypothetical protein n=1 Tax=Streptomyces sp. LMG1-1-1.1 TaxID=3135245 RepID=UPI0034661362
MAGYGQHKEDIIRRLRRAAEAAVAAVSERQVRRILGDINTEIAEALRRPPADPTDRLAICRSFPPPGPPDGPGGPLSAPPPHETVSLN